jgi:UDP-4-amino-4,6-dideoxy-N-acetyl-beta-L-altrosamine N-acetyltransferase
MYQFKNFVDMDSDEVSLVWRWRNNPDIRKWSYTIEEKSLDDHINFIESLRSGNDKKYWLVYRSGTPIGVFSLVNIKKKTAELGLYIGPTFHLKFFMVEFVYNTLLFIFEEIKIRELYGYVKIDNNAANALDDFFGFSKEIRLLPVGGELFEYYFRQLNFDDWVKNVKNKKEIIKLIEKTKTFSLQSKKN